MTALPRRLLIAALLPGARALAQAAAPTPEAAIRLFEPDNEAWARQVLDRGTYAMAPRGEAWAVAVAPSAEEPLLRLGLVGAAPGGGFRLVAGPAVTEVPTAGFWQPTLQLDDTHPLAGHGVIGVRTVNAWWTTLEQLRTDSLSLFLLRDASLRPIFDCVLEAEYSEASGPGQPRRGWSRRYTLQAGAAPRDGLPDLLLRDRATGRVLLRPRWAGERYDPAVFDRMGRLSTR